MRHVRALLALLCVLAAGTSGWAARIHGHVLDAQTGEVLIGASLRTLPPPDAKTAMRSAATNLDGYFVIAGLPAGEWPVEVSYQGYEPARVPLTAVEGEGGQVEIRLKPAPLSLQGLEVTAERTEQELQKEQVYAGNIRLDQKQLDMAPVLIQRDLLHSLFTVPGVLPTNDYFADLNVRGSRVDENLVLLDGFSLLPSLELTWSF